MILFGYEFLSKAAFQDKANQFKPKAANVYSVYINDKIQKVSKTTFDYEKSWSRTNFLDPEWDLAEIGRYASAESYFARSIKIKTDLGLKHGWNFVGRNSDTVDYIRYRMKQLSISGSETMEMMIYRTFMDLIQGSNAFWVKVRLPSRKIKGTRQTEIDPVAAYFYLPAETVKIRKTWKKVVEYKQWMPSGHYRIWPAEDVVHFYYDRKGGFITGMPAIIPVLEDIKLLRTIEENIALLIHKNLFPLFHYLVGTKEHPAGFNYQKNLSEVEEVRNAIEVMPAEGILVTDHRHEIRAVGSESKALRIEAYLQHFKLRVFGGLGISGVDVGEGDSSNRSTSEVMSKQLIDGVKGYQRVFEWLFDKLIIEDLLLQSDLANKIPVLAPENEVHIKFPEIDIESKIKIENHATQLWLNSAITLPEFREILCRDPMTQEQWEGETFYSLVTYPLAKMKLDAIEAKAKATGSAKLVASKSRPSNQHGTLSGPKKYKNSAEIDVSGFLDENKEFNKEAFADTLYESAISLKPFDNPSEASIIYSDCLLYAGVADTKIKELVSQDFQDDLIYHTHLNGCIDACLSKVLSVGE